MRSSEVTRPEAIDAIHRALGYCDTFEKDTEERRKLLNKTTTAYGTDQDAKKNELDNHKAQESDFKVLRSVLESALLIVEKQLTYRQHN